MRISTLSKALAAAALCAPLSACALLAVPNGPVCLAGNAVHADKTIARDLANVVDYQGPQALPAAVARLIRAGQNPAAVVQTAVAYGGNPKAIVDAAMATGVPRNFTVLRVAAIACGADPTLLTPPAGFGGFGGFPGVSPVPQSLGGDPVSPS